MPNNVIAAQNRALDANGAPIAGALAYVYATGTTTLISVYSDPAATVPTTNPVVADGNGLFPQFYVNETAKLVVKTSAGATVQTMDPVPLAVSSGSAASVVSFSPTATVPFTNVQAAIEGVAARIPSPTGKGGQILGANAMGADTTFYDMRNLPTIGTPAPNHFLAGDPLWNRAQGAATPLDPAFWENGATAGGITATRTTTGVDATTGEVWVEYTLTGTMSAASVSFGYISVAGSQHAATTGQVKTVSARLSVVSGSAGSGIRLGIFDGANTPSSLVTASTPTLVSVSRTLTANTNVRCFCQLAGSAGTVINAVVRLQGLQFEDGPARTAGRYAMLPPAAARTALGVSGRNVVINGRGRINQRGYVSGTATTGANQYTLDRWRVVTSGQSLTFTGNDARRDMTAPAGGVEQVVEAANITGGTYALNWTGTATATVNGTARANGELFTLPAFANATVRFTNGTFTDVQLELGGASAYETLMIGAELRLCQRYYFQGQIDIGGYAPISTAQFAQSVTFPVTMRSSPTVSIGTATSNAFVATATLIPLTTTLASALITASGAGNARFVAPFTASSEL